MRLEPSEIDLFGFSIGGFVAQELALIRPALVRRLVLAATGPKGAPGMHAWREDIAENARRSETSVEALLYIFFAHTDTSRAKGREFLGRSVARTEDRDAHTSLTLRDAQYDAIVEWGIPDHGALQRLTAIRCPTLIIQGDSDLMIPTKLSHLMAGLIPDAQIRIYPDSAHACLFQEPEQVAADINAFGASAIRRGTAERRRCRRSRRDRSVDHEVNGQRGEVLRADHAPGRQRRAQLLAPGVEALREERSRQRRVDEARGDEVDAKGRARGRGRLRTEAARRDVEAQHDVVAERLAHLVGVHLQQRPVVRAAGRDHAWSTTPGRPSK
jgi:Alpha/beta hydrolase family